MTHPFAARLDALQGWRSSMLAALDEVEAFLDENDLREAAASARCTALRQRLAGDRRTVAVVGEFSRGKSELINAMLLAGGGQRILPATPGRTTMCPVELGYEPGTPPWVALLPIETRRDVATLAELRAAMYKVAPQLAALDHVEARVVSGLETLAKLKGAV